MLTARKRIVVVGTGTAASSLRTLRRYVPRLTTLWLRLGVRRTGGQRNVSRWSVTGPAAPAALLWRVPTAKATNFIGNQSEPIETNSGCADLTLGPGSVSMGWHIFGEKWLIGSNW